MADCLFCQIVQKKIPAKVVFEDEQVLAFEDINPQAPVHLLVIPRKHLATLNDVDGPEEGLAGHLLAVANRLAKERGVAESGYRVVINVNRDAQQTVFHLHVHVLGGRGFKWPPG